MNAESNADYGQLVVYAEGFTTNNCTLMPFKRGVFDANLSVKPMVLKYEYKVVSPAFNYSLVLPLVIL
jgi:hypothetical protein